MAATVSSPWSKPGSWAIESEQSETPELTQPNNSADFPTLAAAKAAKPKKKKAQTLSLAEFTAAATVESAEPLVLPTGPRQRSAEELDRNRLGGGFKNYGSGREEGGRKFSRDGGRESMPPPTSRADEVDNWGAGKRLGGGGGGFERRERDRGGFFGESKADGVDNWASSKVDNPRRERRGVGFGNGGGADSDNWGRKKEGRGVGFGLGIGGGANSDSWGRKTEERSVNGNGSGSGGVRPRLNLQPRSLPVDGGKQEGVKTKGVSPFGEARPREEVLKEKGQDWKEIDEKLEVTKIKEKEVKVMEREGSFGKRGFSGRGNGSDDRIERSWRKPEAEAEKVAVERPQSAETVENGGQQPDENQEN